MLERFQENFNDALRNLQIADHMTYITFPLINEQKLLLKIFDEIYKSVINCINSIIEYESLYRRIKPTEDSSLNLRDFFQKYAKDYSLSNEQVQKIKEIIEINIRHKQSAMEFVRNNKIVILSDNLNTHTLDLQKIKEYLLVTKEFLLKTSTRLNN